MAKADLRVLHSMRCVGFASEERLVKASGLSAVDVRARLDRFLVDGLVHHEIGPFGGWGLTEAGRAEGLRLVAEELEESGTRDQVFESYQTFLGLNPTLLQLCTDWQMRKVGPSLMVNDHSDAGYDTAVVGRLLRVNHSAQAVVSDLAGAISRFRVYKGRLEGALQLVLSGRTEFLADEIESYHSIWFNLHEDLLVTLGISREDERAGA